MRLVGVGCFAVAACIAGCGGSGPGILACTDIAVSSLTVTVIDMATGQRVCDATVTANSGSQPTTLMAFPASGAMCSYSGPYEQAGTFTVTATKTGYQTATQSGIVVGRDQCHVMPQMVTLNLVH